MNHLFRCALLILLGAAASGCVLVPEPVYPIYVYDPSGRAIGGAALGAGMGAALGAIAGGGQGAAVGALAGGAIGALSGAAATPYPPGVVYVPPSPSPNDYAP